MEGASRITKSVLARRELAEVLRRLGDDIVEEMEDDAARGRLVDGNVELHERAERERNGDSARA